MPTIVSLNPCADAILHEVAAPGQLLAVSHYSHDPGATSMRIGDAFAYPPTGGTVEEILAFDPDVVVADTFLAPATRSALQAAGVEIVTVGMVTSLEDSLAQIELLSSLSQEPERGESLAQDIQAAWVTHTSEGPVISTLLWQEGGIVAGEGSLAFALLEQSGFDSHSAARGLGQGTYLPLEQVLADPPELILASGDERMLSHPVLEQLDGVRYDTFDSALLYCGGPTIPRALERLAEIREAAR
ncbi:ABC transporter substrate-binding protein [Aurantiacibacter sp. D1-12]|uniref:ABC transporter substrate-binding protein n=1 Tax=Aurantiacibacter sp. D1-12 TaxID=2993658 RepID=UPI00237C7F4C|nr:ABC transporter substrate-binding protein [Aurantiacibacter sp. D1-12]MDE1468025.1 ABC transporter substrate-binding protein [Aurantiacibacter sp. D1-12]